MHLFRDIQKNIFFCKILIAIKEEVTTTRSSALLLANKMIDIALFLLLLELVTEEEREERERENCYDIVGMTQCSQNLFSTQHFEYTVFRSLSHFVPVNRSLSLLV